MIFTFATHTRKLPKPLPMLTINTRSNLFR